MASAKQIKARKAFAKKFAVKGKKKTGVKSKKSKSSSNPHGKTESIAQLEKKLDMMLQKGGFDIHGNFKAKYDPQFLAGIEKLQKLKSE